LAGEWFIDEWFIDEWFIDEWFTGGWFPGGSLTGNLFLRVGQCSLIILLSDNIVDFITDASIS
jgi:hypothetical protein